MKKFFSLEPEELKKLRINYDTAVSTSYPSKDPDTIKQSLSRILVIEYDFSLAAATLISNYLYKQFSSSPSPEEEYIDRTPQAELFLMPKDLSSFKALVIDSYNHQNIISIFQEIYTQYAAQHPLMNHKNFISFSYKELVSLLLAFMVVYRFDFHERGYVKYSRDEIFHLASLSHLPQKTKEIMVACLHSLFDLQFQVVGSTNPIPCFIFKWMFDIPHTPDDSVHLGPVSPTTISSYINEELSTLPLTINNVILPRNIQQKKEDLPQNV